MKGMEEKMLKKKNEFFVIFGMLALCAMLVSACEDEGGGGGGENPPAEPTTQEQLEAAIGSLGSLAVGEGTASTDGNLSFLLTGGTNEVGATFEMSSLKIAGTTATAIPLTYSAGTFTLVFPASAFVSADALTGDVVTFDIKAKKSGSTSTTKESIKITAGSIETIKPAIAALRQVASGLATAGGGSVTIAGETSAGSIGTITVGTGYTGTISTDVGDISVILPGVSPTDVDHSFGADYDALVTSADFVIGTLASNVLSLTDAGYYGSAGITLDTGSVGTYTAAGEFTVDDDDEYTGSFSTPFQETLYGSVSASFNNIVLTAAGLKYTAPVFTITVHTTREGEDYDVLVGTTAPTGESL
jgi:hypothetical protein